MASRYELELIISSAKDLKNVNRRHGSLKPYVVVWVDPAAKLSTKVDNEGDTSPCWNETLLIPVPSRIEDSTLYLDVVHFKADDEDDTKPVVGSARLFLHDVVEVKVSVRDPSYRAPESAYSTPCIDQVVKKEEADVVKVAVHGKSHVMPTKKLGRRECQLVTFDLPYLAFYYNQKLLFYKGCDFEDMVVYDDEMEGVEVLEASADHVSVSDLTDVESTSMMKDMLPHTQVLNFEGLHKPLLVLQVIQLLQLFFCHDPQFTKLRDGLAMGCAFNHAVLDGTSTWHFMSSWAEICNGADSVSVQPFLDRTKARKTRVKFDLPLDPTAANPSGTSEPPPLLRERIFRFSESQINQIKSTLNKTPSDGSKPFSTFQSLSTHVWLAVTRARQLKPEDVTVYTVFANCRKRVDPPMPESYFGNLIQAIFTVTAAGLLYANPPEFAAAMIQKAIVMHDAKAINKRNDKWESNPIIFQFKDAGVNCVTVGSSPRFKVYDVDFGFGKPERVRSGSNNKFDGMVYLYQGKTGGGSIDVEITLEAGTMERLEKDKEFLMEV
ncbi:BAHD acyltransferase DCR [Vitis vinifera]|uniref:BAHD acyltransferase DCR n=1 Tax=Vitis vinifera TaxID=29760 RepID=A0A438IYV3_VITVI|nr:BAHD acyltransferase DCR [Vitis vinifera]